MNTRFGQDFEVELKAVWSIFLILSLDEMLMFGGDFEIFVYVGLIFLEKIRKKFKIWFESKSVI